MATKKNKFESDESDAVGIIVHKRQSDGTVKKTTADKMAKGK